jgi:hypothetical protein
MIYKEDLEEGGEPRATADAKAAERRRKLLAELERAEAAEARAVSGGTARTSGECLADNEHKERADVRTATPSKLRTAESVNLQNA